MIRVRLRMPEVESWGIFNFELMSSVSSSLFSIIYPLEVYVAASQSPLRVAPLLN